MFLKGFCLKSCFLLSFLCGTETRNALARQALYYWTTLLILISQLFEFLLQGCTLEMLILKCLHKLSPAHPQCCFLSVFAFSFETSLHSTNWCWWCCILKPPTHMLASPYRPSEALWWSHIPYSLNRPTFNQDCFIHCLDLFSCPVFDLILSPIPSLLWHMLPGLWVLWHSPWSSWTIQTSPTYAHLNFI